MDIGEGDARKYASIVMDLFGYDDRIIDNILEHEERQLFYILESEGILNTEREEIILYDGRNWRIHYWLLRKNKILQYSNSKKWANDKENSEKPQKLRHDTIYSYLPKHIWTSRRF
ncbi:MAG: hypothetical protein JSW60_02770 [Thermoplasmatales archaeon]|nr:MAG: hypothetical protein JSW60_02770 [Thermoplasmatales archaeon]